MSDYTKLVDYAAKDALSTGNPNKVVRGAELDSEFDAIETAIATKADASGATLTGATLTTPTLTLKQGTAPTPTAEGDIQWDTDDNKIVVGDGASQKHFVPTASVSGDATMSTAGALTIANSAVTAAKLASDAVETAKILNSAVTEAKIADGAVTSAKIGITPGTSGNLLTSNGSAWVSQAPVTQTVAQIQPISASVGSNALTISASALSLDFRSTTLGSGAVTRVTGTPANLVISSGSTLGTVNNVQSDIAVLALNNAGTIELAAVNIAGGVNLDETGLISTTAEGGAGAADSSTVVYSTTARTNVAYRVLGIIRSTQTTAGTWATAPSTIQGYGGNALAAMQSLGYGQTWQDVSGSRSSGTTYYNTTGKPIMVSVFTALSYSAGLSGVVSGVTIAHIIISISPVAVNNVERACIAFVVPPGASYSVTAVSVGSIDKWNELR